jgi:hypothetical protein
MLRYFAFLVVLSVAAADTAAAADLAIVSFGAGTAAAYPKTIQAGPSTEVTLSALPRDTQVVRAVLRPGHDEAWKGLSIREASSTSSSHHAEWAAGLFCHAAARPAGVRPEQADVCALRPRGAWRCLGPLGRRQWQDHDERASGSVADRFGLRTGAGRFPDGLDSPGR